MVKTVQILLRLPASGGSASRDIATLSMSQSLSCDQLACAAKSRSNLASEFVDKGRKDALGQGVTAIPAFAALRAMP